MNILKFEKDFLAFKKCQENLYFWLEVELYRNPAVTGDEQLESKANQIYNTYFAENAPSMVNIDSEVENKIRENIDSNTIDREMFSFAQEMVFKLMETACVSKFHRDFYLPWKGIISFRLKFGTNQLLRTKVQGIETQ